MTKEVELQKVELKVSVNCCDGCKKKVKKVLRSIEGVLKIEVDPLQPKVIVLGNVDPQILIKKLLKVGKQAEAWSCRDQIAGKEKKEAEMALKNEKGKPKTECQTKFPGSCGITDDRIKGSTDGVDGNKNKGVIKDQKEREGTVNASTFEVIKNEVPPKPRSEVNCTDYPSLSNDRSYVKAHSQCYHMVGPSVIALPYYAIPSCMAPPVLRTCYGEGNHNCGQLMSQPPATRVGDYFSDENTAGCRVM